MFDSRETSEKPFKSGDSECNVIKNIKLKVAGKFFFFFMRKCCPKMYFTLTGLFNNVSTFLSVCGLGPTI